ncbi:MAG TPA: electron transfer flavoprotein subunit alpha/FixB family protein [Sphingobacteriaceae bacterium]|nr:electron transfer flavoprotein subunit alpha/FixB family protein [Sphingobacteriaceae bacterium]
MSVLVYIENTEGSFKKSVFEVISYAKATAALLNTSLTAISIGNVDSSELESIGEYGVSKVLTVDNEQLKTFNNQAYASIITQAVQKEGADVIVFSNSFSGKGLAPRVAAKLEAAYAGNVISLPEVKNNGLTVKRNVFSGKAFAYTELTAVKKVIAINPNSFELRPNRESVSIEEFSADINQSDFSSLVKEIIRATDKVSLTDAEIVVSAGRGLKGPENWNMIEELAEVLGAATACSKPVSDSGWRPHEEHVGQTGITVSPNLYIAIGISGAIQHLAGVSASKTIVVINKDSEAPFFKVADYGIVGDAFEIVPKLIQAIKDYKSK